MENNIKKELLSLYIGLFFMIFSFVFFTELLLSTPTFIRWFFLFFILESLFFIIHFSLLLLNCFKNRKTPYENQETVYKLQSLEGAPSDLTLFFNQTNKLVSLSNIPDEIKKKMHQPTQI